MQAETLNVASPYFSGLSTLDITEKKVYGFERSRLDLSLEKTINNYLKTPAEMDAEFSMEMNSAKLMLQEQLDIFDIYGTLVYKDGNNNAYSSEDTPSGFMEENY